MNWSNLLLMRLAETLLFSTVFLIVAMCLRGACRRPALRMALAWGTLLGLLVLAIAPWISVRPQARVATWLKPDTEPAVRTETSPELVSIQLGHDQVASDPLPVRRRDPVVPESDLVHIELKSSPTPSTSPAPMAGPVTPVVPVTLILDIQVDWSLRLAVAWLAGSILLMTWMLVGRLRAVRLLRRSQAAPAWVDSELQRVVTIARRPGLRITSDVSAAAVIGTLAPRILLPTASVQDETAQRPIVRAALAHEWAHIRHGDLWLLALERLLLPVYFIHPLYWLLRKLVRADQELLADAAAAGEAPEEYAAALVEWAKSAARPPVPAGIAALSMWDVRTPLTRRVEMLLNSAAEPQPVSRRRKLLAMSGVFIAGLALSLCTLQAPGGQPPAATFPVETAKPKPGDDKPAATPARSASVEERLLELDVRDAEVELERAELPVRTMLKANEKVPGTVPTLELEVAQIPVAKAKIALERAKLKLEGYRQEHPQPVAAPPVPAPPAAAATPFGAPGTIPFTNSGRSSRRGGRGSVRSDEEDLGFTGQRGSQASAYAPAVRQNDADFLGRIYHEITGKDATHDILRRFQSAPPGQFDEMLDALLSTSEHLDYWKRISAERSPLALSLRGDWVRKSATGVTYWRITGPMLTNASENGESARFLVRVRGTAMPGMIDLENLDTPGHVSRGLFKIEGTTLTVCLGRPDAPRPAEFKSNPGGGYPLLLVYEKETKSTVEVSGSVESLTSGAITLTGGRTYSISGLTEFFRITTTGETRMTADDITDQDEVRFAMPFPFTGVIKQIEVVRRPPTAVDPGSVEGIIQQALDKKVSMHFDGTAWPDALKAVLGLMKVPLVLDEKVLREAKVDVEAQVSIHVDSISLRSALRLLLEPLGVTYVIEDSKLKIIVIPGGDPHTSKAAADARTERFKAAAGALVTIRADVTESRGKWMARGAIIDPRGYLITVSVRADRLTNLVVEQGGKEYAVKVVAADSHRHLALLKIDAPEPFPTVSWSPRDPILFDMAFGPIPDPTNSIIGNRITAVDRELTIDGTTIHDLLVVDLPGHPRSMGPLLDDNGNLVALVTHIAFGTDRTAYATPARKIREFVSEHLPAAPGIPSTP